MLLDQQVPMETAFAGPLKLHQRIGSLDAATLAGYDPSSLADVFKETPAVHRFPGSMAARVQSLCAALVQDWGGDAVALWTRGDPDAATVLKRLKALPGFGEQKAKIFLALLGKQYGFTGAEWREGRRGPKPRRTTVTYPDRGCICRKRIPDPMRTGSSRTRT